MSATRATSARALAAVGLDSEPEHPFLRPLWRELKRELEVDLNTTLKVAVMLADSVTHEEAMRRLELSRPQMDQAVARLERIVERIDQEATQ